MTEISDAFAHKFPRDYSVNPFREAFLLLATGKVKLFGRMLVKLFARETGNILYGEDRGWWI